MTRHLLLVALAAVLAHTAFAQFDVNSTNAPQNPDLSGGGVAQPCPFDCLTCNSTSQTCNSCTSGFRLDSGRCHLEQCDTAMAHPARMVGGGDDTRMATWDIDSVDGSTHTVTINVFVPPRFHCQATGHALTDALHWEEWLNNDTCPADAADFDDGFCGPIDLRWTPVLMLGRESDDTEGYIELPVGIAGVEDCTSAYRADPNSRLITDLRDDATGIVTSFDDATGEAVLTLPLYELTDGATGCVNPANLVSGELNLAGPRYQYWFKSVVGGVTSWRFDATICYVDSTGEQSVCPFSSPVWDMQVNEITDGVSVTPAGTAELIYVPQCELFIRSAQIRYDGTIETRNATGEFEIAVTCQGTDYFPDIVDISHCECEADSEGECLYVEDTYTCDATSCTTTALFKSKNFNATDRDYLQQSPCPNGQASNDKGKFVVEIGYGEENCVQLESGACHQISNTKLFGAAPLQSTDQLLDLAGYGDNSTHSIYAGLMKSNDLRVPTGEEEYFHQFNRTYLEFTTIKRVVGPDQKNSFVMCAMMQPEKFDVSESIDPEELEHIFKVTILEVTFDIEWDPETTDNKENTVKTLSDLLADNARWPSQWVWEHQEDLALRREIISRRGGRAETCGDGGACQITPMQNHVLDSADWDHIEDNIDCVGISPFYLYSLLTLDNPEHIVNSASVNLTVKHEYLGPYTTDGNTSGRRLLQADGADAPFSQETEQLYGGAFAFTSKADANKVAVDETPTSAAEPTSLPVMPIVMGVLAASMTCMFFAAFAFWRRRKQPTREEAKLGQAAHTQARQPQVVVQLEDVQLQQEAIAHSA